MAEKHKSKYKKPENKKPTYRKDIKDYTLDNKDGNLNPKSAGEKIPNLLRKTDKEMQDDGKMYPTYNADDRLYKDLEDGDYDPKTALKRMKNRQDKEEKDVEGVLQDKIENLTREQKERLVREYIRRKIARVISERALAEQPAEEDPNAAPVEEPTADPAADPAAAPVDPAAAPTDPAADPNAAPVDAAAGAAIAAPIAGAMAGGTETPPPAAGAPAPTTSEPAAAEPGPEERQTLNISKVTDVLSSERSNLSRIEILFKAIDDTFKDADPSDVKNFYRLMLRTIAKHYKKIDTEPKQEK
jgi:hypothetical protein